MTTVLRHLKQNVVAYLALFVALGGTGYAAIRLPAASVGTKQLRNGAVTNRKLQKGSVGAASLDAKSIAGYVKAYAVIDGNGTVVSAHPGVTVLGWRTSAFDPGGTIRWRSRIPNSCFITASTQYRGSVSYANAILEGGSKADALTNIFLSAPAQVVAVAAICPEP